MRFVRFLATGVLLAALSGLGACGDDSTGSSSTPVQGQFADVIVDGLDWSSGGASGRTNGFGEFTYVSGNSVQFALGDIPLGAGVGRPWMTPVDLVAGATDETHPTVTNMGRFLQTIDDDDDLGNGIQVTDAIRTAAAGQTVDFTLSTGAFASDAGVLQAVTDMTTASTAGQRPLRSVQASQTHLAQTLLGIYSGRYEGRITDTSGVPIGTFTFDITSLGDMAGTYQSGGSSVVVSGALASDGSFQFAGQDGTDFVGMIAYPSDSRVTAVLTLTGGWYNTQGQASGNLEGSRTGDV